MKYKAWEQAKQGISEAARKAGIRNPIQFQGQYLDDETGLHYNRMRYYDPHSGRFVSKDLIELGRGYLGAHMKYVKTAMRPGVTRLLVEADINLNEFRSLMREFASTLSSKVEWISMPEAEIGKIKLSTCEIYAKLDFEYGLELDCDGLTDHEIFQIEAALLAK